MEKMARANRQNREEEKDCITACIYQMVENRTNRKARVGRLVLKANFAQAVCSPAFLLGIVATVLIFAVGTFTDILIALRSEELLENGFHITLIQNAVSSDEFVLTLSILCTLPFTASYMDDVRSGYIKSYLPRTNRRDYIRGKLLACMLSGGMVLVAGILVAFGLDTLVFLPMEKAVESAEQARQMGEWLLPFLQSLLLVFVSGAFWSLVGMVSAALTASKYMAYAAPFIFYYLLVILCERYFKNCYVLYPKEWIYPEHFPYGWLGVVIFLTELSILLSLVFCITEERRLEQI